MTVETAYRYLYIGALILIGIGALAALVRTIRGPRLADRIMGVNMTGSLAIMAIAILAKLLDESWLVDVALIYGMISFLAVVVLTKSYITVHFERQRRDAERSSQNKGKEAE